MKLRYMVLMIVGVALIALSACGTVNAVTTANVAVKNASESKQFAKLCKARPTIYAMYVLVGSQIVIPAAIAKGIETANVELRDLCLNPPGDAIAALKQATGLYNRILESNQAVASTASAAVANAQ